MDVVILIFILKFIKTSLVIFKNPANIKLIKLPIRELRYIIIEIIAIVNIKYDNNKIINDY